jgi:hypothetical protein
MSTCPNVLKQAINRDDRDRAASIASNDTNSKTRCPTFR